MKKEVANVSLGEALAYMCNLPKVYVETLDLDKKVFFSILANLADITHSDNNELGTSNYIPLQYDMVQRYCSSEFPMKYVWSHYSQYRQTINAAILIYYKSIKCNNPGFGQEEYEKIFGKYFVNEQVLADLENEDIVRACIADVRNKINKERLAGHWQEKFEENWRKKWGLLLEKQIVYDQVIRDNFFPLKKFDELHDQGAKLKNTIKFLDKLETEGHDRLSDDVVLVPYEEYHALHELLLERPREKERLRKKHTKIATELVRIFPIKQKNSDNSINKS